MCSKMLPARVSNCNPPCCLAYAMPRSSCSFQNCSHKCSTLATIRSQIVPDRSFLIKLRKTVHIIRIKTSHNLPTIEFLYSNSSSGGYNRSPGENPRDDVWLQGVQPRRSSMPPPSQQEEEILSNQRWDAEVLQKSRRKKETEVQEDMRLGTLPVNSPNPTPPSNPRITITEEYNYINGAAVANRRAMIAPRSAPKYDFAQLLAVRAIWIIAPITLLITAALPTICLPVTYLFSGSALAGLLALIGLDGFFNIGATAFLLMCSMSAENWLQNTSSGGDAERDSRIPSSSFSNTIPKSYKLWSWAMNVSGLMVPVIGLIAAYAHGQVLSRSDLLPVLAMVGPYVFILFVQTVAESLVRMWESPVWPVLPLVYQGYRLVQLARAVELGLVLSAPDWLTLCVKMLASWWVMVMAMQAMWLVRFMSLIKKM